MPPLYHTLPGEEFDNDKSQVYAWIKNQPNLMEWLWRQLGSAGYIVYDPETGKWTGVDYKNEVAKND
nr:MAG TPA: Ig gamma-1 chain C region-like beta-sandwich, binding protein, IMMUNE [Caudoviricetes sp.]